MRETVVPRSPLLITAIQLGLLVFAIYYTFIGGQTAHGIYDHQWRLITQWLISLLIGCWLLWRLFSCYKIPRTPLDFPLLFLLLSWVLATVFSINVAYSREALVFFITYLFFFYIAADLGRWAWFTELVFNGIIGVSGSVWALALLQFAWWYQKASAISLLLQNGSDLILLLPRLSVLGNSNVMASYIALILPLVLYKITVVSKSISRMLLILWAILLFGAILLTQSRGGLLGLVVAIGFYIVVWGIRKEGITRTRLMGKSTTFKSGVVFKGIWLLVLAILGGMGVFAGLILNARGISEGLNFRQQVMIGAVKTLLKHPLFGAGPGTLGEALIRYQKPLDVIWSDAHNLLLTLMAETGLIGIAGVLWLGGVSFKILWDTFRYVNRSNWNMAGMACVASLLGFMAHNMVDSLFKSPLIMLLVAILAGIWVSTTLSTTSVAKSWACPMLAMALGILIVMTFIGIRTTQDIKAYNQGINAAVRNDWREALAHLYLANQLAPMPFYQRQLGFVAGYLAAQEVVYRGEAIAHYKVALSQLDQLPLDHANLACLLWTDGQRVEARQEMALAHQLEPDELLYRLNLGYYLEMEGNYEAAWDEYARVVAQQPGYLQSSYWRQTDPRAAALPRIIERAVQSLTGANESNSLALARLYFQVNDFERALQIYDDSLQQNLTQPVDIHLGRAKILFTMGRFSEAKAELQTILELSGMISEVYLYLSKIALAEKDIEEAEENIEASLLLVEDGETLYQAASVAEAADDQMKAIEQYEAAFAQLVTIINFNSIRYETEVARRYPLPASHLPCLVRIYPTSLLVDITQSEGELLERQGDYVRAAQVYRRLLVYEPTIQSIAVKLDRLCQDHPKICGD